MTSRQIRPERWFSSATTIGPWSMASRLSATQSWCRLKASANPASPQIAVAEDVVEVAERRHRLVRHERQRGQRGRGGDDAGIARRRMGDVAGGVVAGRQAPAIGAVARQPCGIGEAMGAVDQRMRPRLHAVVGVGVAQAARVEAEEGVLRQEQRPAPVRAERQRDAVVVAGRCGTWARWPSSVIDRRRQRVDGERRRRARRPAAPRSSRGSAAPSRSSPGRGGGATSAPRRREHARPSSPRRTAPRSARRARAPR